MASDDITGIHTLNQQAAEHHLTPQQRWHVAWALTWPAVIFDPLFLLVMDYAVRRYLGERSADVIDSLGSIISVFVISPWIVRRVVRLNFPDFHIVVVRPMGEATRAMSYRESFSVAWLFFWRTVAVAIFLFFGVFVVHLALRGVPPERPSGLVPELVGPLLTLLSYLWLVPAAMRKTYSDFVLQLRS